MSAAERGGGAFQRCNCCYAKKPERQFSWAVSGGERYRDKTCKECRKDQRQQRERNRWADPLAARFLRLPAVRFVPER